MTDGQIDERLVSARLLTEADAAGVGGCQDQALAVAAAKTPALATSTTMTVQAPVYRDEQ